MAEAPQKPLRTVILRSISMDCFVWRPGITREFRGKKPGPFFHSSSKSIAVKKVIMQFFLVTRIDNKRKYLYLSTRLASNHKFSVLYYDEISEATPFDSSKEAEEAIPTLHNPHHRSITVESVIQPVSSQSRRKQSDRIS